jgi:hypothetical protein
MWRQAIGASSSGRRMPSFFWEMGRWRLKPHADDIRVDVNPVHRFLNERDDPRSSYYLDDAATEFQVPGLELDWTSVTWDGDLRFTDGGWQVKDDLACEAGYDMDRIFSELRAAEARRSGPDPLGG